MAAAMAAAAATAASSAVLLMLPLSFLSSPADAIAANVNGEWSPWYAAFYKNNSPLIYFISWRLHAGATSRRPAWTSGGGSSSAEGAR